MKKYCINGMFLCQRMTGIERYAYQIVSRMNHMIDTDKVQIEIMIPFELMADFKGDKIRLVQPVKRQDSFLQRHYWLNVDFPKYCKKSGAIGVNFCNLAPMCNSGIVTIHDIIYKSFPQFFSFRRRLLPDIYYKVAIRHSKHLVTVSAYTKKEIVKYYKANADKIDIIGNGYEHILEAKDQKIEDSDILKSLDRDYHVFDKGYYLAISSISPHKNFSWVIEEAKTNPDNYFVIVGASTYGLTSPNSGSEADIPSNVIFTGYLNDIDNKYLISHSKALLMPSYCEGFGLPPIETLALKKPIIISDRTCLPEIYDNSACYIDPDKTDYKLDQILDQALENMEENREKILAAHNWTLSTELWCNLLYNL